MKIVFLVNYVPDFNRYGLFSLAAPVMYPYGVLTLASFLEKNGFNEIKVIDVNVEKLTGDQVLENLKKEEPDIIAVSVYSLNIDYSYLFLKRLKEKLSDSIIIAGGPHITIFPKDLIEKDAADFCIAGEGEFSLLELLQKLKNKEDISDIPNLVYKRGNDVITNPQRDFIGNLDTLPYPALHLIEHNLNKYYPQPLTYRKKPVATLITSRGCPYNCKFCCSKALWRRKWRAHSAGYTVNMIKHLIENYKIKEICFFDEIFNLNKQRVIEICRILLKENIKILWSASVALRNLDEETLYLMKKSGCRFISCGIETGNAEVMKHINKPLTIDEAESKISVAHKIGIKLKGYFILGHIKDTKKTIKETINFSKKLPLYSANFSLYAPSPGSDFYEELLTENKINEIDIATYRALGDKLDYVSEGLTSKYLIRTQKKAFFSFFLRPRVIAAHLISIRSLNDIKKYTLMLCAALLQVFALVKSKIKT